MVPFGVTAWCGMRVFKIEPGLVFRCIVPTFIMPLGVITLVV